MTGVGGLYTLLKLSKFMNRIRKLNQRDRMSFHLFIAFTMNLLFVSFGITQSPIADRRQVASIQCMSWDEYAQGLFAKPYVVQIQSSSTGALLYYGAEHSRDSKHSQFSEIERYWHKIKPQIAFVEGRLPPAHQDSESAIRQNGESGFVRFLADRHGVPVASMDSSIEQQTKSLLRELSGTQAKTYFILREIVRQKRVHDSQALDLSALSVYMKGLQDQPALRVPPNNVAELATCFDRYFDDTLNYRDATQRWFDPMGSVNWVNQASRKLADDRNIEMVRKIVSNIRDGKRVFAVVGRTHTIMQEPAIRALILP